MAQCGAGFPYSSDLGTFNVSQIKGCAPLAVEICVNPSAPCDCVSCTCDIIFDDGNGDTFTNTYTTPGTYTLEILYQNNPTIPQDQITIVVTDKNEPEFNVYACSGNRARIDILDNQYDNYNIDFGDGTQIDVPVNTADQEHSYISSNTRTITLQGYDNNAVINCPSSEQFFTPLATLPALILSELNVIDDSQVEIRYQAEANVQYQLEIQVNGTGNFNFLKNLDNEASLDTLGNLELVNNYYCFRVASFDPCTNAKTYSNTICSILLDMQILDGSNQLDWITSDPTGTFSITRLVNRDNGSTNIPDYGDPLNSSLRSYLDIDIECNEEHCYTIEADYGGGISTSNQVCGIAISTLKPDSISDISISIVEQGIQLYWLEDSSLNNIYRIRNNNYAPVETTNLEYLGFANSGNIGSSCYEIETIDACGNSNSTEAVCSIYLEGAIATDNTVTLSWNEYIGFENGVSEYSIEKYYDLNAVGTNSTIVNSFEEVDNNDNEQILNYKVTAIPANSTLPPAESQIITLIKPNNIYYPSAFTPDGNGVNETFSVRGRFIIEYRLQIFNRWGEMVYATESPEEGWDGTYNSKPQQEGTYIFNLEIVDLAGREIKQNGSFLLLRR